MIKVVSLICLLLVNMHSESASLFSALSPRNLLGRLYGQPQGRSYTEYKEGKGSIISEVNLNQSNEATVSLKNSVSSDIYNISVKRNHDHWEAANPYGKKNPVWFTFTNDQLFPNFMLRPELLGSRSRSVSPEKSSAGGMDHPSTPTESFLARLSSSN